jgi:hypothetical protein
MLPPQKRHDSLCICSGLWGGLDDDDVQDALGVISADRLALPPGSTHDSLYSWYGLRGGWDEGDVRCVDIVILIVDQRHLRMATVKGVRK